MADLSLIGHTIDAAEGQAGANGVQGLQFSVRDSGNPCEQALGLATKQAKAHAEAIASGIGASLGAVVLAQEGGGTPVRVLTTAGGLLLAYR